MGGLVFSPSGPLFASSWIVINERPFQLGKSGTVPLVFPNLDLYATNSFLRFSFHQFSDLLSSIHQALPPTSSSVIIRVCRSFL